MSQQMIDAFIKNHGTPEGWDGARESYYMALGAFTLGWQAHEKAVQKMSPISFGAGMFAGLGIGFIVSGLVVLFFGGG